MTLRTVGSLWRLPSEFYLKPKSSHTERARRQRRGRGELVAVVYVNPYLRWIGWFPPFLWKYPFCQLFLASKEGFGAFRLRVSIVAVELMLSSDPRDLHHFDSILNLLESYRFQMLLTHVRRSSCPIQGLYKSLGQFDTAGKRHCVQIRLDLGSTNFFRKYLEFLGDVDWYGLHSLNRFRNSTEWKNTQLVPEFEPEFSTPSPSILPMNE
mmetsp:Transcript_12219/g.25890  ORF Transcript_12219/g.25890 Transcript_12219/m.25890 type:complete len:210 (-) Transcript_12219:26-655(-)